MKQLQINLPDDIHKKFKHKCIDDNTTMTQCIINWINNYLKGYKDVRG